MYTESGTLIPTPPFNFDKSLNFLGAFMPTRQEQTISSHTLTKAISIDGQTIVFQLISIGTTENPQLEYTLFSTQPITEETQNAVVERMTFFLSLEDDLQPFYRIGQEDVDFSPIIELLYGYHQVKFLTPFENACWAVLTQRNPMKIAQKSKHGYATSRELVNGQQHLSWFADWGAWSVSPLLRRDCLKQLPRCIAMVKN